MPDAPHLRGGDMREHAVLCPPLRSDINQAAQRDHTGSAAAEQALQSGNCAAVLLWSDALDDAASRRLQLAAEKGRSWAIAFRALRDASRASAAALRIRVSPRRGLRCIRRSGITRHLPHSGWVRWGAI